MVKIGGVEYPTVKEAAERFGVTAKTVQDWIAKGIIPEPDVKQQGLREVRVFPESYLKEAEKRLEEYRHRLAQEGRRRGR